MFYDGRSLRNASWSIRAISSCSLLLLISLIVVVVDIDLVTSKPLDLINTSLDIKNQADNGNILVDDMELAAVPANGDTESYMLVPAGLTGDSESVDRNIIENVGQQQIDAVSIGNHQVPESDMLMLESNDEPVMVQYVPLPASDNENPQANIQDDEILENLDLNDENEPESLVLNPKQDEYIKPDPMELRPVEDVVFEAQNDIPADVDQNLSEDSSSDQANNEEYHNADEQTESMSEIIANAIDAIEQQIQEEELAHNNLDSITEPQLQLFDFPKDSDEQNVSQGFEGTPEESPSLEQTKQEKEKLVVLPESLEHKEESMKKDEDVLLAQGGAEDTQVNEILTDDGKVNELQVSEEVNQANEARPDETQANKAQENEIETDESKPHETQSNETQSNETHPNETQSNETQADETQDVEAQPSETQEDEAQDVEAHPSKTPADGTQAAETQSNETQADETQAAEAQPSETPADETPAAETQAAETQAAETQAAETQAAETPAAETQAAETPADETQAAETQTIETEGEAIKTQVVEGEAFQPAEAQADDSQTYESEPNIQKTDEAPAILIQSEQAETELAQDNLNNPEQTETNESQPEQVVTNESQPEPEQTETNESQPEQVVTNEIQPEQAEDNETQADGSQSEETEKDLVEAEDSQVSETKVEEIIPQAIEPEETKVEETNVEVAPSQEAVVQIMETQEVEAQNPNTEESEAQEPQDLEPEEVEAQKPSAEESEAQEPQDLEPEPEGEDIKSEEAQAEETQAVVSQDTNLEQTQNEEFKDEESQPEETQADESQPEDTQPDVAPADETQSGLLQTNESKNEIANDEEGGKPVVDHFPAEEIPAQEPQAETVANEEIQPEEEQSLVLHFEPEETLSGTNNQEETNVFEAEAEESDADKIPTENLNPQEHPIEISQDEDTQNAEAEEAPIAVAIKEDIPAEETSADNTLPEIAKDEDALAEANLIAGEETLGEETLGEETLGDETLEEISEPVKNEDSPVEVVQNEEILPDIPSKETLADEVLPSEQHLEFPEGLSLVAEHSNMAEEASLDNQLPEDLLETLKVQEEESLNDSQTPVENIPESLAEEILMPEASLQNLPANEQTQDESPAQSSSEPLESLKVEEEELTPETPETIQAAEEKLETSEQHANVANDEEFQNEDLQNVPEETKISQVLTSMATIDSQAQENHGQGADEGKKEETAQDSEKQNDENEKLIAILELNEKLPETSEISQDSNPSEEIRNNSEENLESDKVSVINEVSKGEETIVKDDTPVTNILMDEIRKDSQAMEPITTLTQIVQGPSQQNDVPQQVAEVTSITNEQPTKVEIVAPVDMQQEQEQLQQQQQQIQNDEVSQVSQQATLIESSSAIVPQKPLNHVESLLSQIVNVAIANQQKKQQEKQQQQQQLNLQQQQFNLQQQENNKKTTFNSHLRRYDGAQVWRIVVQNDRDKKLADELQTKYDAQLWKEVKQEVDYLLKPQVLAAAEKHVRTANLSRTVLIDNLQNVIEVENPPAEEIAQLQNRKGHRLTWQAYHRLEDIHGFFDYLAKTYPDICSVETIGYSIEKRPLKILKVSNGNSSNPGIWIDGGMHAREWISPATVTFIANEIVEGWDDLPSHMKNINWYIHAVANPDGYEYSHTTDRLWRKNMRSHGRQCPGVDLNRNFGYKWGGKGTSANPCSQTYRGSKAFSEPETFYISKFISNFPRETFQAYLSFHSYGQYILYPWGYDYHLTKDRADLDSVARQAGSIITKSTGTKYTVGSSATTLYPAAGGSDDWAKGIAGIKYSFTIEMGDTGRYGFVLPANFIQYNGKDGYTFVDTVARAILMPGQDSLRRRRRKNLKLF